MKASTEQRDDRPHESKYEVLLAKHKRLLSQHEKLLIDRKQLLTRLQAKAKERAAAATERAAASAFAIAAMRSPIAGHVYLHGEMILLRNNRFREMAQSDGGPWRADDGVELRTLTEVVCTQGRNLRAAVDVVRYTRADGELVIEVRTERIQGDRPLVVATVMDVSAIANAARAAEAARSASKLEAMQEASRNKDEFLGVLSHELRNPLAPIRNSVYILDRVDAASEQGRRAREVLKRQVGHLASLVDDLLDVTRMERGKFEIRRDPIEVSDVVRRAAEDHRGVLRERGIELTVETPSEPVRVVGDDQRIAQVVGNLLHNAAKFTGDGGRVTVSVCAEGGAAEVRVHDTGVGMDSDLIQHVFDPFAQARQSLARTAGGLGLGLALVKGVVELHGGTVHASSAGRGHGSEFLLRFPLAEAMSQTRPDGPPPPRPPRDGRRRRVLVVDDNGDAASSLADLVKSFGHEVEVAQDGASALQMVSKSRPDVVLCDIGLPGMNGYEVAQALRARRHSRPTQLIAVSGYARPDDVKRALDAGFDAHVAKPCDPDNLARVLS